MKFSEGKGEGGIFIGVVKWGWMGEQTLSAQKMNPRPKKSTVNLGEGKTTPVKHPPKAEQAGEEIQAPGERNGEAYSK